MQKDTAPNPDRFQVFTEIPNGKGFKIKGSHYIYFFDKYGGWYDEFNNYYNADGDHQDPPSDEDDDFERVLLESEYYQGGDDDDYYDKLYGGSGHTEDYDDYHDHHQDEEDYDHSPVIQKPTETKNQTKKKYFAKNSTTNQPKKEEIASKQPEKSNKKPQNPPKQEKKPTKDEVKPTKDQVKPQKEDKKEPTWAKYQAEMTVFPKKQSFKEWMQKFGFSENEHFKNLTKVDSKEAKDAGKRFATVDLRSDAFEKMQGREYEKTKVTFEKVN